MMGISDSQDFTTGTSWNLRRITWMGVMKIHEVSDLECWFWKIENMLISPFNWFTPKICLLLLFDLSFFFSLQSVHRFNAGCKKTTCIWNFLFWVQWATLFIFCGLHSDKLPTLQHLSCLCLACPPPPNPFWVGTLASAKPSIKAVISWSYDQATQKTGRLVKFRSSCCFWRIHKKNIRRSLVKRISYFCWSLFSSFNKKPN